MRNTLVQYKGGGYEGCFWEWNFFVFDKNGKFHNVFSSGSRGIETEQEAWEFLQNEGVERPSYSTSDAYYLYDLQDEESLWEFANETNPGLVKLVVEWFENFGKRDKNGNYPTELIPVPFDNFPFALCSKCGEKITDPDETYLEDFRGCGGVAIQANSLYCSDCYITCEECGEYFDELKELDDQYLCSYCYEEKVNDNQGIEK